MYILQVTADFEAAHRLPNYNGPCRRIHGHRWVIYARYCFERTALRQGMCCDLVILKKALKNVTETYDHDNLNSVINVIPTAENIARIIYERLRALSDSVHRLHLCTVEVYETPGCSATYSLDPMMEFTPEEGREATMQIDALNALQAETQVIPAEAKVNATLTIEKAKTQDATQVGIVEKGEVDEPASE